MSALFGTYQRSPLAFVKGEGMRLFTEDGTSYLDFNSGIAVNALGHADPHLVETMKAYAGRVWHVSNVFTIPEAERLAQRLCEHTFAESVFFTNSGTEAIECAIKTARRYFYDKGQKDRYEIIGFSGSFHGRSTGAIAAGGHAPYLEGFGPPLPGFKHTKPGDLEAVKALVNENTAAILIEPIQGEGGINVMSNEFMRGLRKLCDDHGMLLILDEIQCGYGRSGKFFAHEWAGITPDIMTVAKGIGSGVPLGACLATAEIADCMVPGTHGSTYAGNPLACAIGNAVFDRIMEPGFFEHVEEMGNYLAFKLQQLVQAHPTIALDVRGKGLIAGVKITPPIRPVVEQLRNRNLLAVAASENVLRLLPPLIVQKADIDEAVEIIGGLFADLAAEQPAQTGA